MEGMVVWTEREHVLLSAYAGSVVNDNFQKVCYHSNIINSILMAWKS